MVSGVGGVMTWSSLIGLVCS